MSREDEGFKQDLHEEGGEGTDLKDIRAGELVCWWWGVDVLTSGVNAGAFTEIGNLGEETGLVHA